MARLGRAWQGVAGQGEAGQGMAWPGLARQGRRGAARQGAAWRGWARLGEARRGKAGKDKEIMNTPRPRIKWTAEMDDALRQWYPTHSAWWIGKNVAGLSYSHVAITRRAKALAIKHDPAYAGYTRARHGDDDWYDPMDSPVSPYVAAHAVTKRRNKIRGDER